MAYKPSDAYVKLFCTNSPTTGASANADSLPVATANHNGTDDGSFTLTVANLDTGRYKVTGTIPSGYATGDVVNVSIAATISSVLDKSIVDTFHIDTKRVSDLHDFNGGAVASVTASVTVGAYASGQDPATLILDTAASGHNTSSTIGAKINSSGAGGDPWATSLPGSYSAGTAGAIVGGNLDAKVSLVPQATLKQDTSVITGEAKYSLLNAIRAIRNAFSISGTTMTVFKEDGVTTAYTNTLATSTGATPITGNTPN